MSARNAVWMPRAAKRIAFTFACVVACGLAGSAKATPAEPQVASAEQAYTALEYAAAAKAAEVVLANGNLSHDELVRATRVLALSSAALDNQEAAKTAFIRLLAFEPDYRIDAKLSPRFQEPFAEARGYWLSQSSKPGLAVVVQLRAGGAGTLRIKARDPSGLAKQLLIAYRWNVDAPYTIQFAPIGDLQIEIPESPRGRVRLDYYVHGLNERKDAVFEEGTAAAPRSSIAPLAAAPAATKSSILSSPIFWLVGGVVLAGAATGTYFAVRPTAAPTRANLVVGLSCGTAPCN